MPEIDMEKMKSVVDALERNDADRATLLSQLRTAIGMKERKNPRQPIDNKRTHTALQSLLHRPV